MTTNPNSDFKESSEKSMRTSLEKVLRSTEALKVKGSEWVENDTPSRFRISLKVKSGLSLKRDCNSSMIAS